MFPELLQFSSSAVLSMGVTSLTCTRSRETTKGLFMQWLLGEPPPWASSVMGAPLLMFPLLSRVEYPFSFLVMPSVETTANQARHTNISNTWRSGYTSLFMLLFSTILSLISGLYLVTEWWRAHADADAPKEVSVSVEDAGETSDSTVLAISSYYLATMASELMKESTKLSVSPPGDLKEETQRKQTHSGFIYNAGPVSLLCGVCQLGLDAHRVLPLLIDGAAVLHEPAAALLAHNGPALKL